MAGEKLSKITIEDALSPQGCGGGTENACFAMSIGGPDGFECLLAGEDKGEANMAGIMLGWRMNIDPADQTPWCPKGVINGSKSAEV